MNKRTFIVVLAIWTIAGTGLVGCSGSKSTAKITVVKPKKRIFAYHPRWHKNKKRTKKVTYRLH